MCHSCRLGFQPSRLRQRGEVGRSSAGDLVGAVQYDIGGRRATEEDFCASLEVAAGDDDHSATLHGAFYW